MPSVKTRWYGWGRGSKRSAISAVLLRREQGRAAERGRHRAQLREGRTLVANAEPMSPTEPATVPNTRMGLRRCGCDRKKVETKIACRYMKPVWARGSGEEGFSRRDLPGRAAGAGRYLQSRRERQDGVGALVLEQVARPVVVQDADLVGRTGPERASDRSSPGRGRRRAGSRSRRGSEHVPRRACPRRGPR